MGGQLLIFVAHVASAWRPLRGPFETGTQLAGCSGWLLLYMLLAGLLLVRVAPLVGGGLLGVVQLGGPLIVWVLVDSTATEERDESERFSSFPV